MPVCITPTALHQPGVSLGEFTGSTLGFHLLTNIQKHTLQVRLHIQPIGKFDLAPSLLSKHQGIIQRAVALQSHSNLAQKVSLRIEAPLYMVKPHSTFDLPGQLLTLLHQLDKLEHLRLGLTTHELYTQFVVTNNGYFLPTLNTTQLKNPLQSLLQRHSFCNIVATNILTKKCKSTVNHLITIYLNNPPRACLLCTCPIKVKCVVCL